MISPTPPGHNEVLFTGYLSRLGTYPDDDAFHSLLELHDSWLPRLVSACKVELNPRRKSRLVQIIWRSKQERIIQFLGTLLTDSNDEVWKEALNGLVAFRNRDAVCEIDKAIRKCVDAGDKERMDWLREVNEQIGGDGKISEPIV